MRDYFSWAAGVTPAPTHVATDTVPAPHEPLPTIIRTALVGHRLGIPREQIAERMLERGAGIDVEEQEMPDTVRTRFLTLQELCDQEAIEEAALLFAKARR